MMLCEEESITQKEKRCFAYQFLFLFLFLHLHICTDVFCFFFNLFGDIIVYELMQAERDLEGFIRALCMHLKLSHRQTQLLLKTLSEQWIGTLDLFLDSVVDPSNPANLPVGLRKLVLRVLDPKGIVDEMTRSIRKYLVYEENGFDNGVDHFKDEKEGPEGPEGPETPLGDMKIRNILRCNLCRGYFSEVDASSCKKGHCFCLSCAFMTQNPHEGVGHAAVDEDHHVLAKCPFDGFFLEGAITRHVQDSGDDAYGSREKDPFDDVADLLDGEGGPLSRVSSIPVEQCGFCKTSIPLKNGGAPPFPRCNHHLCPQCVAQLIETALPQFMVEGSGSAEKKKTEFAVTCPIENCPNEVQFFELRGFIDEDVFQNVSSIISELISSTIYEDVKKEREREVQAKTYECGICMSDHRIDGFATLDCNHRICWDCLKRHIETSEERSGPTIKCAECQECVVGDPIIRYVMGKEWFQKFEERRLKDVMRTMGTINCPKPGCDYAFLADAGMMRGECVKCKHVFCIRCREDFHPGSTCEEYEKWKKENGEADRVMDKMVRDGKIKRCPKCRAACELLDGCDCVLCFFCKTQFCIKCMKIFTPKNRQCAHAFYHDGWR
eukprot:TRINITY_DN217_c0_g3_i1.p1 TRINITY_DN217_c0_g3~~TRINITY_DN217_c0_g3_i1.p1  ORF type:complete len:608 (+),score=142.99 TRINITY_DN217_c0_g3_i1:1820-3643(+)